MSRPRRPKKTGSAKSASSSRRGGRAKTSKKQAFSWWRLLFKAGLAGAVLCLAVLVWFCYDLPDTAEVQPVEQRPSIAVLAHDGTMIARYGGLRGNIVTVDVLPKDVVNAFLATEDRRFYSHFGIDPIGLARAMFVNVQEQRWVQGGSTITQQLAKNLFLTPDKTLRRKAQEALLALIIEIRYDKQDILAAYLNRVYYGSGAYGIDSAARTYFSKPAEELTLWEGAVLAGLLKAPSRYSPSANPKLARDRARVVLQAMEDAGFIDEKRMKAEIAKGDIKLAGGETGDLNRYFADWIINQIDSYVIQNDRDIVVRTTLDLRLQNLAEKQVEARFAAIAEKEKITQAALVTLAPDGAVMAMIGGKNYTESQFNRATQAQRQPGSSFKPFVYLAALEAGFSKDDIVEDAPITEGSYRPKNYENKYFGPVTLEDALALSMNTATIRILEQVGLARLMDVTTRLGFTQKFKYELATGLGADESTLLEMTNAYAVIANGGHAIWPYAVLTIEDTDGNVLYRYTPVAPARLFATRDMAQLDAMLVQVVARGTGQAAQLSRGHAAGKTGTTQSYRDAWFIGYTDRLVTGVWMGNDDNTPMEGNTGGRYPARLWRDYMQDAIAVDTPQFVKRYSPPSASSSVFSSLLERLTGAGGGTSSRFTGDNKQPQYNR